MKETLVNGSRHEVEITGYSPRGEGRAELMGHELLVPETYPGERVEIEITGRSRHHPRAFARLLRCVSPHPQRREPPCPQQASHPRGRCTGCPMMTLEASAQRALKREQLEERFGWTLDDLRADARELGYRWSSKRVAGGPVGRLRLGSWMQGSHHLADMRACQVDHPRITACLEELEIAANSLGVVAYDEKKETGDLRYVWAKTDGDSVLLTLITGTETSRAAQELPAMLELPAGVAWSVQGAGDNRLRGTAAQTLIGRDTLSVSLAGHSVDIGPLGFLQPNPPIASIAYRDLVAEPSGSPHRGQLAYDLYAGAGVTTHLLRQNFEEVIPCESYPESAAALGVEAMSVLDFLRAKDDTDAERIELVIANPPRSGLGAEVCAELLRLAPSRLQIMSCHAEGLARDLNALDAGYRCINIRGYDTLPQTPHLELVAWLESR